LPQRARDALHQLLWLADLSPGNKLAPGKTKKHTDRHLYRIDSLHRPIACLPWRSLAKRRDGRLPLWRLMVWRPHGLIFENQSLDSSNQGKDPRGNEAPTAAWRRGRVELFGPSNYCLT